MLSSDQMKAAAAMAAIGFVDPAAPLGIGTGSTVDRFIDALGASDQRPAEAVATSIRTERRLTGCGIEPIRLEAAGELAVYVDGADEIDAKGHMIKGAGGASTLEKRVASASKLFVCIVDETKVVERLGERAPVPVEVLPAAARHVTRELSDLGGWARHDEGRESDTGGPILDVTGLDLSDPVAMERAIEAIPGVVGCGIFALRRADVVLVGTAAGEVRMLDLRPRAD